MHAGVDRPEAYEREAGAALTAVDAHLRLRLGLVMSDDPGGRNDGAVIAKANALSSTTICRTVAVGSADSAMILARMTNVFGAGFLGFPARPEPPARRSIKKEACSCRWIR